MRRATYPRHGTWDERHGVYFKGHDIPDAEIVKEFGADTIVQRLELHLHYIPRIKWCANWSWPCEEEGEWHAHYVETKPGPGTEYTFVWDTL